MTPTHIASGPRRTKYHYSSYTLLPALKHSDPHCIGYRQAYR